MGPCRGPAISARSLPFLQELNRFHLLTQLVPLHTDPQAGAMYHGLASPYNFQRPARQQSPTLLLIQILACPSMGCKP